MATIDDPQIEETYKKVRHDGDDTDWMLLDYVDNVKLHVSASGSGGVSELATHLKDDAVQYGYLRASYSKEAEGEDATKRTKFIFIAWGGPKVSILKKGKMSVHKASVKEILKDFSVEIQTSDKDDLEIENVIKRLDKANY